MDALGTIAGVALGLLGLSSVIVTRAIYHNLYSFINLSGSYLNLEFQDGMTTGIDNDERSTGRKITGSLGHLGATLITLPSYGLIFAVKKCL